MSSARKELLITHKVIEDVFDYQDFEPEISKIYVYFENSFQKLFDDYASLFNIKDYCLLSRFSQIEKGRIRIIEFM